MTPRTYTDILGLLTINNHSNITSKITACFDKNYSSVRECVGGSISICNSSIKTIDIEMQIAIDDKNKNLIDIAKKLLKSSSCCTVNFKPMVLLPFNEELSKYHFSGQILEVEIWENYLLKLVFSGLYYDQNKNSSKKDIAVYN